MSTVSCPVCGNFNNTEDTSCRWCTWDLRPVYGLSSAVQDTYEERLAQAKAEWEARNDQPELARDPFETPEEYQQRLVGKAWYIGTARLLREHYDIETGRFPFELTIEQDWYHALATQSEQLSVTLSRDDAKAIYEQSATWPCLVRLSMQGEQVSVQSLLLRVGDTDIQVERLLSIYPPERCANTTSKKLLVRPGDKVIQGQCLLLTESGGGLESEVVSPVEGEVVNVLINEGDSISNSPRPVMEIRPLNLSSFRRKVIQIKERRRIEKARRNRTLAENERRREAARRRAEENRNAEREAKSREQAERRRRRDELRRQKEFELVQRISERRNSNGLRLWVFLALSLVVSICLAGSMEYYASGLTYFTELGYWIEDKYLVHPKWFVFLNFIIVAVGIGMMSGSIIHGLAASLIIIAALGVVIFVIPPTFWGWSIVFSELKRDSLYLFSIFTLSYDFSGFDLRVIPEVLHGHWVLNFLAIPLFLIFQFLIPALASLVENLSWSSARYYLNRFVSVLSLVINGWVYFAMVNILYVVFVATKLF